MTVHCEGECRIVEQLGEKQDFEAELSSQGFPHEHFTLRVSLAPENARPAERYDYAVSVGAGDRDLQRVYFGGPGRNWIAHFTRDLTAGVFGRPAPMPRFSLSMRAEKREGKPC